MRLLVVGAGASHAEGRARGLPDELCPPLMSTFARNLWAEFNPHLLMSLYLRFVGFDPGDDARELFTTLEALPESKVSIERFFAFAWQHQNLIAPGHHQFDPASEYENLLLHGILTPLSFLLIEGLLKPDATGATPLPLTERVAGLLQPSDAVLNLNYDPIFEIGAEQAGHRLVFAPNVARAGELSVAKPHGSMNLFMNRERKGFWFARPFFAGSVQPSDGSRNYLSFVPPRFGKAYAQHPIAAMILGALQPVSPLVLTFWGVGLTDSDSDLLALFQAWSRNADVEFINPNVTVVIRASALLGTGITHYVDVAAWEARTGNWIRP